MIDITAKNRILTLWKEGGYAYEKVKKEEYKQMYYAVLQQMDKGNAEWRNAVRSFLFHGAYVYDRFVGLRPKVESDEEYDMFCRFVNTLQKLDGKEQRRTACFNLDRIRWNVFTECSGMLCDSEIEVFLQECEEKIAAISVIGDEKVARIIEDKKTELRGLIADIREGRIRTKIHTTLPFKLTNTDATVSLKIDGVNVEVSLNNHSQGSSLPMASIAEGSTMTTTGASKWTTTTCELDIEAHCLIDGLQELPRVTVRDVEQDKGYWNAVFDFTYRVVSAIWMHVQQREAVSGSWPPLPNDIHYLQYTICAGDKEYDMELSTNPALVYQVTSLKKEPKHYDIAEEGSTSWSAYTYLLARQYAESGQLKESIFWLNVSVEALVEEFVRRVATTEDVLNEIEGEDHKFDTAEEILSEQFPEMKGKVVWPDTTIPVSVFTKLKRAVKLGGLAVSQKDVRKRYSMIHDKRNSLFHGRENKITVEDVEKAFGAYVWLREKLE